ncbi:DNA polymerase III subunit beta [Frigidibacter sp. MR17.14]|uniref:DNA polymerase III subunit beta n=1 Tax=Frigidibacter sp. MR17.14 TaxID=3126509 RepID=UPI003012A948
MTNNASTETRPAPIAVSFASSDLRHAARLLRLSWTRHNTTPVIAMVRVVLDGASSKLSATDLDSQITVEIDAEIKTAGTFLVHLNSLASMAEMARGRIRIRQEHQAGEAGKASLNLLIIEDDDTTIRLVDLIEPSDYPAIDAERMRTDSRFAKGADFEMAQGELLRMLKHCRHCISTEETRYYLNGVYLCRKPEAGTLRAVATDGHRMCCADSEVDIAGFPSTGVIVPTRVVRALEAILDSPANEPVRLEVGECRMIVTAGRVRLTTKTIDGTYPSYEKVIPERSTRLQAHLSRSSIDKLLRVAGALGHSKMINPAAKLIPSKQRIEISNHEGSDASAPAQVSADPNMAPVAYNLRYLAQQARVTPEFTLSTGAAGDPAIILAPNAPDTLWVLMPMRA